MACIVGNIRGNQYPAGYERRLPGIYGLRRGYPSYGPVYGSGLRGCFGGGSRYRSYLLDPYFHEDRVRRLEDEVEFLRRDQYRTQAEIDEIAHFLRRQIEVLEHQRPRQHQGRQRLAPGGYLGGPYLDAGPVEQFPVRGTGSNQAIVGRGNAPVNVNIRNGAEQVDDDLDNYDHYEGLERPLGYRPRFGRRY